MHHANINCVLEMLIGQPAKQLVARCLVFLGICLLGKEVCVDEDIPENLEIGPLWQPSLPSCLSSNSCWYLGLPHGSCRDDQLCRLHDSMSWQPLAVMPCWVKGCAYISVCLPSPERQVVPTNNCQIQSSQAKATILSMSLSMDAAIALVTGW